MLITLVMIPVLWCRIPAPVSASETCSLPGCNHPKYVDPANNRTHDFCSRGHAFEAQKRGNVTVWIET